MLDKDHVDHLADAIARHPSLKELDISGLYLSNWYTGNMCIGKGQYTADQHIIAKKLYKQEPFDYSVSLLRGIAKNNTLTKLRLENCHLSPRGSLVLAKWLQTNRTLRWLDVSKNKEFWTKDVVDALCDALRRNSILAYINFCHWDDVLDFFEDFYYGWDKIEDAVDVDNPDCVLQMLKETEKASFLHICSSSSRYLKKIKKRIVKDIILCTHVKKDVRWIDEYIFGGHGCLSGAQRDNRFRMILDRKEMNK